jgi:hypothetical protein
MESNNMFSAGFFMQAIDVLRDEPEAWESTAPSREYAVRGVRLALMDPLAAPVVPLPDERRITPERFGSGKLLGRVVFPEPIRAAKCGDTAGGGYTRAREHGNPRVSLDASRKLTDGIIRLHRHRLLGFVHCLTNRPMNGNIETRCGLWAATRKSPKGTEDTAKANSHKRFY